MMRMDAPDAAALHGRRILVAEDEYMIAEEVESLLRNAGARMLGPVASVDEALALIAADDLIDAALLDVSLNGGKVWPLVDALLVRNVPVVLTTGYDFGAIPTPYATLPRCEKPACGRDIIRAISEAMSAAAHT